MINEMQWIVFFLYAFASFFYWYDFLNERNTTGKTAKFFYAIAIVAHLLWILFFILDAGRAPIATVSEALGTFVWITSTLYFFHEFRLKDRSLGVLILTVILILLVISILTFNISKQINPILYDVKFEIHVLAMLLGYSGFTLSFIASVLHIILTREIQNKHLGLFFRRLPSLAFFERISAISVNVGLVFIAAGFILGFYFAAQVWNFSIYTDPKIIMVFLTWIVYFSHFIGRKMGKIRGQRAAIISVVGFVMILFSFLLLSTFIPGVHHFG